MGEYIESTPGCMGGQLRLKGHRITVTQLLAEIADDVSIGDVARDFRLKEADLRGMLRELSGSMLPQPWQKATKENLVVGEPYWRALKLKDGKLGFFGWGIFEAIWKEESVVFKDDSTFQIKTLYIQPGPTPPPLEEL